MSHTFEQVKHGYANLWNKAKLTNGLAADDVAQRIIANKSLLIQVQNATDVPWWLVGCWLYRESDLNFGTYLGNGQSILRTTTIVPKNRGPFGSFLQGAVDAIRYEHQQHNNSGFYKLGLSTWVLEYCLWATEEWNGEGYFSHNIDSPYVWNWTSLYITGKFDSDGHFNPTLHDSQGGVAAIMMALFTIDPTLKPSRIASEVTMTTAPTPTTTVPAKPATLNVGGVPILTILQDIDKAAGYIPMIATFFPPLAVAVPFVPIIEGVLEMVEELSQGGQSPDQIIQIIATHLQTIGQNVKALQAAPATTTAQSTQQESGG